MKIYTGWVKASDKRFYYQQAESSAKFGFVIHDDDQTWEVPAFTWKAIKTSAVPQWRQDQISIN